MHLEWQICNLPHVGIHQEMGEIFRRRRLPHLDKPGATYFVTSCLEGSISAEGLLDIERFRTALERKAIPDGLSTPAWEQQKWKLVFARVDEWFDQGLASNYLINDRLAGEVEQAILHFAGVRYAIWVWVVLSNHFHWVFEPLADWVESLGETVNKRTPRERILQSIKRYSARECKKVLDRTGNSFWQDEAYDHCVSDSDELHRIIEYVELNPLKAGLCRRPEEFRFSSAWYRVQHGLPPGRPLIGQTILTAFD